MEQIETGTLKLLVMLWPVLLFLLGLAAAWGGMLVRMRKIEQAQRDRVKWQIAHEKRVKEIDESIKHRLYSSNHEPLFVTVGRCERTHEEQNTSIKELVVSHKELSKLIHMHLGEHGQKQ